jgi:hypothetical protein
MTSRFAIENTPPRQRDQLLRKLKRAVVIRAVRGKDRQAEGVVIGAHQMIGIESGCSPRPGALLLPGIYLIKVSFSLSGAVFWTLMRYIRQYNKDPKTVKMEILRSKQAYHS